MRKYKIRQKSTGLFFLRFVYGRGLTKTGKPRKTGPRKYVAVFEKDMDGDPVSIELINDWCRRAIYDQIPEFFEDTEILAYEYHPTKCSVKLGTMRNRWEQKIIMEKLRTSSEDYDY